MELKNLIISRKQKDRGAVDDVIARSEKQMLRFVQRFAVWKAREISPITEIRNIFELSTFRKKWGSPHTTPKPVSKIRIRNV